MKTVFPALLVASCMAFAAGAMAQGVGTNAPDFNFGTKWNVTTETKRSDYLGKWVELIFTATW